MPIPIPTRPPADLLARYRGGEPASAMHFRTLIQKTNWLRAHVVQPYFSGCFQEPAAAQVGPGQMIYNVLFIPTPGVQVIRVQFETHAHTLGNTFYVDDVLIDGVSTTPIVESGVFSGSTGAVGVSAPADRLRSTHVAYFVVDTITSTSVHTLTLLVNFAAEFKGLSSLSVCEVPLPLVDPSGNPTTEPGVNEAWPDARNRIFAGTASTGAGTQRMIREATYARTRARQHWQIVAPEDDTKCFKQAASVGFAQLDYQEAFGTTYDPTFYLRAKRRSAVNTNAYKVYIRYKWAGAAGTALFRATIDSSEDNWANIISTDTTGTINLANTAGGYVVASDPCTLFLDGAGQRNRVTFGAISDTHDLYITNIALIEEET